MPGAVTDTSYEPGGARTGTTAEFDGSGAPLALPCPPITAVAACSAPSEAITISAGPGEAGKSIDTAPDASTRPAPPTPSPSPGPARPAPPTTSTVRSEWALYAAAAMNDPPVPRPPASAAGGMTSNTTRFGAPPPAPALPPLARPPAPSSAAARAPASSCPPRAPPRTVPLPPTIPLSPYADGPTTNQSVALPCPGTATVSEAAPADPVRNEPSSGHPSACTRAGPPGGAPPCAAGDLPTAAMRGSDVWTSAAVGGAPPPPPW